MGWEDKGNHSHWAGRRANAETQVIVEETTEETYRHAARNVWGGMMCEDGGWEKDNDSVKINKTGTITETALNYYVFLPGSMCVRRA